MNMPKLHHPTAIAFLALSAVLAVLPVQAEVLLYEPFDYPTGGIAGKGGSETGFTDLSTWSENSARTTEIQADSISFGTLVTTGNKFHYLTTGPTIDVNKNASRPMSVSASSGDLYITYLMKGPNGGRLNGGVYVNGSEALQEFGALRSQYNTNLGINGVFEPHVYFSGESVITGGNISGATIFMYVQQFTNLGSASGGTARLWIIDATQYDAVMADGTVTPEELDLNNVRSTPILTLGGVAPTLDGTENLRLHLMDNGSGTADYILDEIRIATTLEEAMGTNTDPPEPPRVAHYWSFNFDDEDSGTFAQTDLYGSADLSDGPNGFAALDETTYGPAFTGAERSLITERSSNLYLETSSSHFQWGTSSFALSYWVYDDGTDNDPGGPAEDLRGPRVFDCLSGDTTGVQLGSIATGVLNLRIDDNAGGSFISNASTEFAALIPPRDQWVHVAVNVDRDTNGLTIFIDGASQGTADISALTGSIYATQALQVGVINNGGGIGGAQAQGLDDLAFYPSLLSPEQVTALAGATTTPLDVLISMEPSGPIPITDVTYAAGEITVEFTTETGKTYSVFGGQVLSDIASWPEISTTDIIGDDTDQSFPYTSGVSPFFLQIRED